MCVCVGGGHFCTVNFIWGVNFEFWTWFTNCPPPPPSHIINKRLAPKLFCWCTGTGVCQVKVCLWFPHDLKLKTNMFYIKFLALFDNKIWRYNGRQNSNNHSLQLKAKERTTLLEAVAWRRFTCHVIAWHDVALRALSLPGLCSDRRQMETNRQNKFQQQLLWHQGNITGHWIQGTLSPTRLSESLVYC